MTRGSIHILPKVMPHTYGVRLDEFIGMRDRLIKSLQELDKFGVHAGMRAGDTGLELAIACLGKVIGDARWVYEATFQNDFYNIGKRRFA